MSDSPGEPLTPLSTPVTSFAKPSKMAIPPVMKGALAAILGSGSMFTFITIAKKIDRRDTVVLTSKKEDVFTEGTGKGKLK